MCGIGQIDLGNDTRLDGCCQRFKCGIDFINHRLLNDRWKVFSFCARDHFTHEACELGIQLARQNSGVRTCCTCARALVKVQASFDGCECLGGSDSLIGDGHDVHIGFDQGADSCDVDADFAVLQGRTNDVSAAPNEVVSGWQLDIGFVSQIDNGFVFQVGTNVNGHQVAVFLKYFASECQRRQ